MADRYWVGGTDDWNGTAGGKWATTSGGAGGAAVPTLSDDVFFDAASGAVTVTVTSTNNAKNLNFTGFTGTFAGTFGLGIAGNLTLGSGMTYTHSGNMEISGATTQTITSNGKTLTSFLQMGNGVSTGTLLLGDDLNASHSSGVLLVDGVFNANNFNITSPKFGSSNSNNRTLTMGSGTWTITASGAATVWDTTNANNLTVTAGTHTIKFTGGGGLKIFQGGGIAYNNLWHAGTGDLEIVGVNTFNDVKVNAGNTLTFNNGQTQTMSSLTAVGTSGSSITLRGDGAVATLSDSSGTNNVYYCTITNLTVTGGATWNAYNSTDGGGNTEWNFLTTASSGGTFLFNMI